jgi:hypothetical protein
MRAPQLWLACLLAVAGLGVATGQDASPPAYQPLFTPEMIEQASPEQATRMRATEQRNRQAWDERHEATRQRDQAAQRVREAEQSAQQPRAKKKKIYRWVDKEGRVNFGDAPDGQGAQEIEVKGIAREQGNPPPPGAQGGERN